MKVLLLLLVVVVTTAADDRVWETEEGIKIEIIKKIPGRSRVNKEEVSEISGNVFFFAFGTQVQNPAIKDAFELCHLNPV